jgi:hypothetical protein
MKNILVTLLSLILLSACATSPTGKLAAVHPVKIVS